MADEHDDDSEHDALSCPRCRGMAEAARVLGGFAEGLGRMIEDGYFERSGREAATRRERAFVEAFLAGTHGPG